MPAIRRFLRLKLAPGLVFGLVLAGAASGAPHRDKQVYQAVMDERAGALDLLKQIVDIDSGTGEVQGGARVGGILAEHLQALGAEVSSEPAEAPGLPGNLVARLQGKGKGRILIIAHIDTVFGAETAAARPFMIDGDRAHGPGVGDEKAGVVTAVTALKVLHDLGFKNYRTITLLLDDSEERGSPGSSKLIVRLAHEADVELNM